MGQTCSSEPLTKTSTFIHSVACCSSRQTDEDQQAQDGPSKPASLVPVSAHAASVQKVDSVVSIHSASATTRKQERIWESRSPLPLARIVVGLQQPDATPTMQLPELLHRYERHHEVAMQSLDNSLEMLEVQQQPDRDPEVDDTGEALIPSSRRSFSYADSASDKDLSLRTGHPHLLTSADDRAISIAPRLRSAGVEGRQSNMHTPDLADEALFQEALQAAKDGQMLRAHQQLLELCSLRGVSMQQLGAEGQALGLNAAEVQKLAQAAEVALQDLRDHSGWQPVRSDDLQAHYRHERGTSVHSFKFEAVFDAPVEHLLALAREFDLTSSWNKYTLDSTILHEESIFETVVYAAAWMPPPFPQADSVLQARGLDLAEEDRSLLVLINDAPKEGPGLDKLPKKYKHRKHASVLAGSCVRLEPLKPGPDGRPRTKAAMMAHCKPPMAVPSFIISFILKVMTPFVYSQMQKVLHSAFSDPTDPLPQRVQGKPELYELVTQRVAANAHLMQQN